MMLSNTLPDTLLNALQEPVILIDEERKILFLNHVAEEMFGKGFTGRDFVRLIRHPDCLAAIARVIGGEPGAGCSVELEFPVRGSFKFRVSRIAGSDGKQASLIISLKDVSDLKDAEQMRSDFVANVSHELRSPLTALSGFIETLKGSAKDDSEARERFLDLMEHEAQRMIRLIADLLSLAKVESNQRIRPKGKADVGEILKRIENTLSSVAKKENKTIKLSVCEDAVVPGSDDELTQVFQNLVENALKYGRSHSTVTIEVTRTGNVAGIAGDVLCVSVSDEGEGIAKDHLPRLTERFYRADTHRSRDKGGTGLGLAIVKHIISRHRGRLRVTSEIGTGSVFTVFLPISE